MPSTYAVAAQLRSTCVATRCSTSPLHSAMVRREEESGRVVYIFFRFSDEGRKGIPIPSVDDITLENPVIKLEQVRQLSIGT